MNWIYLSPHFDDAVFSCGGLIWEQTHKGDNVQIWTICAGDIPTGSLSPFAEAHHLRWQTGPEAVDQRRLEDQRSCKVVSASFYYFPLPDGIYRRAGDNYWNPPEEAVYSGKHLYTSNEALFGRLHPDEFGLVGNLSRSFAEQVSYDTGLVCPLSIGGHVDHRLTRMAAELLGRRLWYYADFPYVFTYPDQLKPFIEPGWEEQHFEISPEGLEKWGDAIAEHGSQISTFWTDVLEMRQELKAYSNEMNGAVLWGPVSI